MIALRGKTCWLVAALCVWSCTGRPRPAVPPSLPGLRVVPEVVGCERMAVGEDSLWALCLVRGGEYYSDYELLKFDLQSNQLALTVILNNLRNHRVDLVVGEGTVWVGSGGQQPMLYKIDSSAGEVVSRIKLGPFSFWSSEATLSLAGDENGLWSVTRDKLFRLDWETGEVVGTIELHSNGLDLEATADTLWVLHGEGLSRVDPSANRLLGFIRLPKIQGPSMPEYRYRALAAGQQELWALAKGFVLPRGTGILVRVDPQRNLVTATIALSQQVLGLDGNGLSVLGLAAGQDALWIALTAWKKNRASFWLIEVAPLTNQISNRIPMGETQGTDLWHQVFNSPLAVVHEDLWICNSSIWRIHQDGVRAASVR